VELIKIEEISSPFRWRASPALIDEDSGGAVNVSYVKDYCRAPGGRLTTRCYGHIIDAKNITGQSINVDGSLVMS